MTRPPLGPARGAVAFAATVALAAIGGCAPSSATAEPALLEPLAATDLPAPPAVPTTAAAPVAELVPGCVELVRFGAFVGDAEMSTWWDEAGGDEDGVAAACVELGADDPWELHALWQRWQEVQAELAG